MSGVVYVYELMNEMIRRGCNGTFWHFFSFGAFILGFCVFAANFHLIESKCSVTLRLGFEFSQNPSLLWAHRSI